MAQDQKRMAIIEAAKKRFIHFGVGKTTMTEVADDLSISKASIYYYFPDKLNLYAAVLQDIIEASKAEEESYLHISDPLKAATTYLESRTNFIHKYYNILEHLKTLKHAVDKELDAVFREARTREIKSLTTILEHAGSGLSTANAKKMAELMLDCLMGIRTGAIVNREGFFPDKKELQTILKREIQFVTIFLKGVTA